MNVNNIVVIMNTQNAYTSEKINVLRILLQSYKEEVIYGCDIIKIMSAQCFTTDTDKESALDVCLNSAPQALIEKASFTKITDMFYHNKTTIALKLLQKRLSEVDFKFAKELIDKSCNDQTLFEIIKIFIHDITQSKTLYEIFDLVKGSNVTDNARRSLIDSFKLPISAVKLSDYFSEYDQFVKACESLNIASQEYSMCQEKIAKENNIIVILGTGYDVNTFKVNEKVVFDHITQDKKKTYKYTVERNKDNSIQIGYDCVEKNARHSSFSLYELKRGLIISENGQVSTFK